MAIENISITAAVPVIIIFLKLVLDTVGMFTVEKILMTNFKRITIYSAQILVLSILSQIILIPFQSKIEVNESVAQPLIISLIAMAITITIAFLSVWALGKLFGIKIGFYIENKEANEKWIIKRMVANNKLLVSKDINSFKFIDLDSMNDREIHRFYEKKKVIWGQNFLSHNAKAFQFLLAVVLLVTSLAALFIVEPGGLTETVVMIGLLIEYLSMMYIFSAINNAKIMKEVDGENPLTSNVNQIASYDV
ncbi:hypothetical protein QWY16_11610 [Planococcus shenhongbingii]|uniref:hypothetical protein n=1 Tax=Planococcus shenhongbingii TaxID=3058398 RepID=UPI0026351E4B|nr:hypothetical protein [Planococcus sp. N016]WKA57147.1 hypothetical protein QWY16_11610 [Planococcus sp. N016]